MHMCTLYKKRKEREKRVAEKVAKQREEAETSCPGSDGAWGAAGEAVTEEGEGKGGEKPQEQGGVCLREDQC